VISKDANNDVKGRNLLESDVLALLKKNGFNQEAM
jgi:hypothetical protein